MDEGHILNMAQGMFFVTTCTSRKTDT